MTLARVVELLAQRGSSGGSSITLARNARGDTQVEVVVRVGDGEIATIDQAFAKATDLYDRTLKQYPRRDQSGEQ